MKTPICDFVRRYAQSGALRLHMPGHKGRGFLGVEALDITEIAGADSLYEAGGIIRESEENASRLFGCPTFYSTEGSSQCIRAMMYLVLRHARKENRPPLVWAGRNAHKTFLSAAALLDLEVEWLYPQARGSYLSCKIDAQALEVKLCQAPRLPAAVYLTSPDYLGETADIAAIGAVCRRHGVLLAVDNAHGAYLRFLPASCHPIELGADLCCDSAHKTLPVLTGGAYLHLSASMAAQHADAVRPALALFGSTSPSYLILQSLDAANAYLETYPARLQAFVRQMERLKTRLRAHGYTLAGDEALKITLLTKPYGYTGGQFADALLRKGIVCEFSDPDFVVMMLAPEIGSEGLARLEAALREIPSRPALPERPPETARPERATSIRAAMLSPGRMIPAAQSAGEILAAPSVSCPPAVPIVVCGERIDEAAVRSFAYYGIEKCCVI